MKVFSPKAMHFRLRTGMVFFVFFMFQKVFSWRLRFDEKFHFFEAYRSRISWKNNCHLFFYDLFFSLFSHNVKKLSPFITIYNDKEINLNTFIDTFLNLLV